MPNWCDNIIEITHEDSAMMERVKKALDEDKFLQEFLPIPQELAEDGWYTWCVDNWGTKWDVSDAQFEYDEKTNIGSGTFMTAWGPPVKAMQKLTDLGFNVTLKYFEPGMCFVGQYTSEDDDEYYEYNFDNEDWRDDIPSDLIECFGLESDYESHMDYMAEEDINFDELPDYNDEEENVENVEKEDDGS